MMEVLLHGLVLGASLNKADHCIRRAALQALKLPTAKIYLPTANIALAIQFVLCLIWVINRKDHDMEFKIDKNIPIPSSGKKYAVLDVLEHGDSHFFPGYEIKAVCGNFACRRPKKFLVRTLIEDGVKGVRVWRIE
jgi:hypothetical protein